MALLGMRDVCWGFDDPPLLETISLQIEKGERICLMGRNGAGKSTLLKLLNGDLQPDSGEVWRRQGIRVATLAQSVPSGFQGTIAEIMTGPNPGLPDSVGGQAQWEQVSRIEEVLAHTGLDAQSNFDHLSAGMKRRTLFARALVHSPDVLLLDEPTNHLDIDTIQWLESYIERRIATLIFITHDRAFVRKIATRILELEQGQIQSYACDYDTFLQRREALQAAEEKQQARFARKLSREEQWIRQGIKARRTRNQGRLRALKQMREAYAGRRRKTGLANIQIQEAQRTGKLVIEAQEITRTYGGRNLIDNFSTVILRGDKVGVMGPNGVGKSTLLRILLQQEAPDQGRVRHGTHLEAVYFDQLRDQLDLTETVKANIGEGNDYLTVNGERRHVFSYLKGFLFSPERCRTPVHVLSGGEQNRLLLAKLFLRPANLLVLDEPTNDLDLETLELLEELLFDFAGTLLLVSHDREFLNRVVTRSIVFEGPGKFQEYAGGYDDWLLQRAPDNPAPVPQKAAPARAVAPPAARRKLSFNETYELKALPRKIDELETEQQTLYAAMADAAFFKQTKEEIVGRQARLTRVEALIKAGYERWEALEQIAQGERS
ncbi:MAG: ATP-binding cassette domain-containing protein [Desulfobacterales bacterium]